MKKAREPKWWNKRIINKIPQWRIAKLDSLEMEERLAKRVCSLIPKKCPFNRQLWLGNRLILFIPPLCHFNPFYRQLTDLRLRAETFLAEQGSQSA